jgi:hypothetical protein
MDSQPNDQIAYPGLFPGLPGRGLPPLLPQAYELYFIFGRKILEMDTLILKSDSALEDLPSMALG